jgi:hypothetical protein
LKGKAVNKVDAEEAFGLKKTIKVCVVMVVWCHNESLINLLETDCRLLDSFDVPARRRE